ncbi:GTA baseplate fiber-binding domain-containing protein [Sphingomonas sp. SAFR-052]|uniref:GTA baseplate fiber-binding domain-containing protein n=1 Tax=Sphingomonas sp. SAFR-052 TaxID=3436867 RepID=UPI003F820FAA
MATVVLTVVGGAIAGPIGAAVGAMAGRAIDDQLFAGPPREGPRLRELQVQLSSYGAAIPKLFGTMRVAGTVIWATDLREAATSSGKGSSRVRQYSYSASFAVALSARPIRGIGRIWAEGKLLRGAAADWKTRTGFRWYPGDEAQAPDPLIESIVGIGRAPAHRGIAYAVFEDLALADFGNRIPSLTFEVIADEAPVPVGRIAEVLGEGAIRAEAAGPALIGYAASGTRVRDAVAALVDPLGGWYAPDGEGTLLRIGNGAARTIADDGPAGEAPEWRRAPMVPSDVAIAYHDIARDYQAGVQQLLRPGGARRMLRVELPAVLDAAGAAAIAGDLAARAVLAGEVRTVVLDWRSIDITAGDRVTIAGEAGLWRVRRTRIEAMRITIELVRIAAATLPAPAAVGQPRLAEDVVAGTTRLLLIELPAEAGESAPVVAAVAAGTREGWRRAMLLTGDDAGGWTEIGDSAAPGVIGTVTLPPRPASALIEDRSNSIEVTLLHDAMSLTGIDAQALDRGGNAALVGDEIVQFARAERIGPARWRLSGLWRGRRGTGAAMAGHQAGEAFVLLDPATLRRIEEPVPVTGRMVKAMAVGIAADDVATATIVPTEHGLVPPAPVHLTAEMRAGMLELRWIRCARGVVAWRDGAEVPIGEEREAYRVTVSDGRTIEVTEPLLRVALPAQPLTIAVRQIGTNGASDAVTTTYRPETK